MIKVINFDFDDTLKISEHLKVQGFHKIFNHIPGAQETAKKYVVEHLGTPRRQMIQGILLFLKRKNLVSFLNIDDITGHYVKNFGALLIKDVLAANLVPGALESLDKLVNQYKLYINTATPQDAIEQIIQGLSWQKYFSGLYGTPPGTKLEHLQAIIQKEQVLPNEVVVVGDGSSDLKIARALGVHFIGIRGDFNQWPEEINFPIIDDLKKLPEEILKL